MAEIVQKEGANIFVRNIIRNKLTQLSRERSCRIDDVRKELLAHLGVTPHQYRRWENNTTQPDLANAMRTAEFFKEEVSAIFFISQM